MTYAALVESQPTKAERQRMERKLNPSAAVWARMLARARMEREKPRMAPGVAEAMKAFGVSGGVSAG